MHFSKTYSQLLLTLPAELQENAIEYRQLKKLINKVVLELSSLGLSPSVLHSILQSNDAASSSTNKGKQRAFGERPGELSSGEVSVEELSGSSIGKSSRPSTRAIYEVVHNGDRLEPRLRLWVGTTSNAEEEDMGNHPRSPLSNSRVAIYLDKPESKPPSPVVENSHSDIFDAPEDDLLLVSKPLVAKPGQSLIWSLQKRRKVGVIGEPPTDPDEATEEGNEVDDVPPPIVHPVELVKKQIRVSADGTRELVIPLASETAFFQLLYTALQSLASHLLIVRSNFISNLDGLARSISRTARPQSSTIRNFHPSSSFGDPQSVSAPLLSPFSSSFIPGGKSKSDLYAWREIFQLYVESEVFEGMSERDRGERDIMETERRLALFAERVTGRGLGDSRKLRLKESRNALETFLKLNVLVVNLKKFQFANAEAARKILKKHAKRTALPFPRLDLSSAFSQADTSQIVSLFGQQPPDASRTDILALIPTTVTSLPHILVQAIGETLLPIIPHLDDYSCLICTSIAFKPIRLGCGHLFCVRCLVKMQKRGQDHCPCCRAPTVLKADRTNVDWALLNFMQDWFPQEATVKLKQNEKEAALEELEELGISDQRCVIA
ncbi:SPX domain-containing protein [Phellopilus nigrolimitatus]|nr:SPX domain-containing protein [Phellopilus nigrolimitatus]